MSLLGNCSSNNEEIVQTLPLNEILNLYPEIEYTKLHDKEKLDLAIFPTASSPDSTWQDPLIPASFIISIPNGQIYSTDGLVLVNNTFVQELLWPWSEEIDLNIEDLPLPKKINGTIAVVSQPGHTNYYHWLTEIVPKILALKTSGKEYDWIYVSPLEQPFKKTTLSMLEINDNKIIEAHPNELIEADTILAPSFSSLSCYTPKWLADDIRSTFIPLAEAEEENSNLSFAKKVFISRSEAPSRKITNEDELFNVLKPQGFEIYHLERMTFLEQVILFKNAEIIISTHGAGLTNLLFSTTGTQVIEIFQKREDEAFWYLSQVLGFNHTCIKTMEFNKKDDGANTFIPLSAIEQILNSLQIINFAK